MFIINIYKLAPNVYKAHLRQYLIMDMPHIHCNCIKINWHIQHSLSPSPFRDEQSTHRVGHCVWRLFRMGIKLTRDSECWRIDNRSLKMSQSRINFSKTCWNISRVNLCYSYKCWHSVIVKYTCPNSTCIKNLDNSKRATDES